jgi:hypothetical protein
VLHVSVLLAARIGWFDSQIAEQKLVSCNIGLTPCASLCVYLLREADKGRERSHDIKCFIAYADRS